MNIEGLKRSPIGMLVPIAGIDPITGKDWHYQAYVPDNLPSRVDDMAISFHNEIIYYASQAAQLLATCMNMMRLNFAHPELFLRPILRKEAQGTSALEGTYASYEEILQGDLIPDSERSVQGREVENYMMALDYGRERLRECEGKITQTLLCELQKIIVTGTVTDTEEAGHIRTTQVFIGSAGLNITDARFVPCPPDDRLIAGCHALLDWMHAQNYFLPIIKLALAHYQFETLHPFNDGNGRVGRLLISLQAMGEKITDYPLLNISTELESRREKYLEVLLHTSITGDFNPWVEFFIISLLESLKKDMHKMEALKTIEDAYAARVNVTKNPQLGRFITLLIGYPIFTAATITEHLQVSKPTAHKYIKHVMQQGIIEQYAGKERNRFYICREIYKIYSA